MSRKLAIGIDLGTTQSYLAYKPLDGNDAVRLAKCNPAPSSAEQYENLGSWAAMPSRIFLRRQSGSGDCDFGLQLNPRDDEVSAEYTPIIRFKSLLGRDHGLQPLPQEYRVEKEDGAKTNKYIYAQPEGIAAFVLWKMRHLAAQTADFQNVEIEHLTITVPALSKVSQRRATQFAARVAGFNGEIYTLEEPIAAFLYHHDRLPDLFASLEDQFVFVFDFGGGTCDVSLIRCMPGKLPVVIARQMGSFGGEQIDDLIIQRWLTRTSRKSRIDFGQLSPDARLTLRTLARKAKESLTQYEDAPSQVIGYLKDLPSRLGTRGLNRRTLEIILRQDHFVTRFNEIESVNGTIETLVARLTDAVIRRANINEYHIKFVILAGGSSKLQLIRDWMGKRFYWLPSDAIIDQSQEGCIAMGAAIHQFYRQQKEKKRRKIVETTLASEIRLEHSFNPATGEWGGWEVLAPEHCPLPLRKKGLNSIWVEGIKKYEGKVRVRLIQGNDVENPLMDQEIKAGKRPVSVLQVSYTITEDGIIDTFQCAPGSRWLSPIFTSSKDRLEKQDIAQGGDEAAALLKEYDLANTESIRRTRADYGISIS